MSQPTPAEDLQPSGGSYDDIVRSSMLIGGSLLLSVAIGIFRNKALALLLGPAGCGLFAIYNSIVVVAQNITGIGISDSGVRQIALAVGSQDEHRIALTAAVLRRTALVLGIFGAVLLLVLSRPVARLTFGNTQHASALSLLALAVLLLVIGDGQMALIHGLRQVGNLARLGVLRALLGALITVPLIWFLRDRGIVLSIVASAAASVFLSWFYTRRNRFRAPALHAGQIWSEFRVLIGMGFALMTSMAMHDGAAWAMKIFLLRQVSYAAAGYYQAAMNLGVFCVGIVLAGMGSDFYPRLSEAAADNATCIRLVNEQTLAGLLLGAPGLLATISLAPLLVPFFYSRLFVPAVPVLRWLSFAALLQLVAWPLDYLIIAKGKRALYMALALGWGTATLILSWSCIRWIGLEGAGIAFFASILLHGLLFFSAARHLTGFRWSRDVIRTGILFIVLTAATVTSFDYLRTPIAIAFGGFATLAGTLFSIRHLRWLVTRNSVPVPVLRLLMRLRLVP